LLTNQLHTKVIQRLSTDLCTENYTRGRRASFLGDGRDPCGLAVYAEISNGQSKQLLTETAC